MERIEVTGWYVVRDPRGIKLLMCYAGVIIEEELIDGPFAHRVDAARAAAAARR